MPHRFRALFLSIAALASACQPQLSPQPRPPSPNGGNHAELVQAAEHFLRAFDNMEWEPFHAAWSASPSAFFPFRDTPERVDGAAVATRFRTFFDEIKATREGPPYLRLSPVNLRAEVMGATGLVTFMLGRPPGTIGRRTLLFVREGDQWKLAHLHASNMEPAAP